ncbi:MULTISPECIES: hypothetical protein [unclassified Microcoleus]|uniref:hypothetical protein n=1 Tax=unclassified Microcoleus TaxID=2642155 RepID=UPI002FD0C29C
MCGRFWQRCDESSSIARVSAVVLWNCREAALHIISPLAIDIQLNFLMFRSLWQLAVGSCQLAVVSCQLAVVYL